MEEMQNKYISTVVRDRKTSEFSNLVQGFMTVTEYDAKFEVLFNYASKTIPTEREKALKSQRGLKQDFKVRVTPLALETYAEVFKRAQLIEKALRDETALQSEQNLKKNKKRSFNQQGGRFDDKKPRTDELACPIYHKNHDSQLLYEGRPCHNCGEYGHF